MESARNAHAPASEASPASASARGARASGLRAFILSPYHWVTVAIAVMGAFASITLAWLQRDIIHMQRELEVAEDIRNRWETVRSELARAEDLQDTIVAFFEASGSVGREQFDAFAQRLPAINFQAVSFATFVPLSRRAEFERGEGERDGRSTSIWEQDPVIGGVPAGQREMYFPVTHLYPATENLRAFGYDLLSEPRRRRALLEAIRTGKTVRTDPVRLVQDPDHWAFLVFKPVYARAGGAVAASAGGRELVGVVSSVYQFRSILEPAIGRRGSGTPDVALFDASDPSSPVFVRASGKRDGVELARPLSAVAALPGARTATATAMQKEFTAVFFPADGEMTWWKEIDATIVATLAIGLLLTAALLRNHVMSHRLTLRLRRATEEGRRRKEEAEEASVAKSRVLAYASHDLRQPLQALELFVAHLRQQPLAYGTAKIVANVDRCVQALGELLDAILDLSRLESGVVQPSVRPVSVAELWERLRDEFAAPAAAKSLELRLRPSPLWLATDPELLHRILLNLVSNAIRYTRSGGVLVACRRRDGRALLQVWDTGSGIAPGDREEVFKEFVQLHNPEGNRMKGLGLGLSIVARTAALLGHRLGLRSEQGRGSCFSVEVPIADPVAPAVEAPAPAGPSEFHGFPGVSVLVVEDDVLARRALVDLLRSWRCEVIDAGTAREALRAILDGRRPDLIATDVRLPDFASGIELVARARAELDRAVPAFLISGDTSAGVIAEARDAGLLLLHKPVKAPRLRRLLEILIERGPPARG